MASAGSPDAPRRVIAAACLGRLGRWGNQIFQWLACALAAEVHRTELLCPDWPGRHVLAAAATDALLTADAEAALPLCADRPVLSHAGWRAWAETREPLASAASGSEALSGRQIRRLMVQVNADVLLATAPAGICAAALAKPHAWWGWFQFHSAAFAPHKKRIVRLLQPLPHIMLALDAALARAPRPLLGIHVRCGEGFTELPPRGVAGQDALASAPAEACAVSGAEAWTPPAHGGLAAAASSTTGAWRDTGVFWAAPLEWYAQWLEGALATWHGPAPTVVVCSDAPELALPLLRPHGARTLEEVLGDAYIALVDALGGGEDGTALADWLLLSRCDALAVSNSTFSFSAAMLASAAAAEARPGSAFVAVRPDATVRELVPFDPWNAPPTLKADGA